MVPLVVEIGAELPLDFSALVRILKQRVLAVEDYFKIAGSDSNRLLQFMSAK